jgi:hypothetical protein
VFLRFLDEAQRPEGRSRAQRGEAPAKIVDHGDAMLEGRLTLL